MSTFMFMLRWQFGPTVLGIGLLVMSAFNLLTLESDPPDAVFETIAGVFGHQIAWIGLASSLFFIGRAWHKASQLRNGE